MKKFLAILLIVALAASFVACSNNNAGNEDVNSNGTDDPDVKPEETANPEPAKTEEPVASPDEDVKGEGVMTYAEYIAADLDTEVVVETYVQAKQSWWDDKATVYTQDHDGAYFCYNMTCSEEDYAKLLPGTKIKVTGYKSEWAGEVEIIDATFEIEEGEPYVAEALDVTELLGTDELIAHQNEFVAFKGLTIEAYDENGAAFAYKNEAEKTDDLYFKASYNGTTYDFCVEYYLCGSDTDVYKAVEALNVGDVVDLEGFLYWYEGANPHVTALTVAK